MSGSGNRFVPQRSRKMGRKLVPHQRLAKLQSVYTRGTTQTTQTIGPIKTDGLRSGHPEDDGFGQSNGCKNRCMDHSSHGGIVAHAQTTFQNDGRFQCTSRHPSDGSSQRKRYKCIPKDDGSYCHTHGYWVSKAHTSANCKWPKEGHQITVTRANPMGGCKHGKPTT
jgi:hypothetical protein